MRLVEAIYKRVTDLAEKNKKTIYGISILSGVPRTTIISIPKVQTVTLATIYGICEGVGITLKEFFDSPLFDRENIID